MNTNKFDFVQIICISAVLGFSLPVGILDADTFYMNVGDCAIFLGITHFMTLVIFAVGLALEEGVIGKVGLTTCCGVFSAVVGAAGYKCLALGLGAGVDFTSVASGTIIGGITMLSILSVAAMTDCLKKN